MNKKLDKQMLKEKIIKCPKCKVNMFKMHNDKFIIDKCPKCKGVFLDANEIQNIQNIGFFRYIRDYFRRGKND